MPFRVGLGITNRLINTIDFFENYYSNAMGKREYIELQRMVVDPDYQGQGIGSKALGEDHSYNYALLDTILNFTYLLYRYCITRGQ